MELPEGERLSYEERLEQVELRIEMLFEMIGAPLPGQVGIEQRLKELEHQPRKSTGNYNRNTLDLSDSE